jgi:hypothetical protein
MICFELFDPDKVKISFEYNNFGGEFLAHLPNVFDGENDYHNSIFLKYKHSKDAKKAKMGVRLNQNKKSLIKNYQDMIKFNNIIIHSKNAITEIETFTRHDTPSGDFTYKSEGGNDDCVMSLVNISTVFNNRGFKNLLEIYLNESLSEQDRNFVEGIIKTDNQSVINSFNSIVGQRKKLNMMNQHNPYINGKIIPYKRF